MRKLTLLPVLVILAVFLGPAMSAAAPQPPAAGAAAVERQVWADLAATAEHRAVFVVVMRETPGRGPASAIDAQLGLRAPLTLLQQTGSVLRTTPYYGANAIVVEGGPGAVRFLSAWPEVAAVRAYRSGEPWEVGSEAARMDGLLATGHIAGKVTAPNGTTGLAGIGVRAYRLEGVETWSFAGQVTTASGGTYDIGGQATGIYRIEFTDPAGNYAHEYYNDSPLFSLATNFSVTDGQTTTINASLAQAGKVSGTVTGAEGGADIVISAWRYLNGAWHSVGSALSASNGTYTVGGLAPVAYRIGFSDGRSPARYLTEYYNNVATVQEAADVTITAGATTPGINASLGSYGKMTGTITGPDGAVIDGIDVNVYEYNTTYGTWEWASWGYSDASGYYVVDGLATRDYRVEFSDPADWFVGEFYDNQATLETATNVHVNLGATTANINAALALTTAAVDIPLVPGWNLIALPVTPADRTPEAVFAGIAGQYDLVYAYDGCDTGDPWEMYDPALLPFLNDLTDITIRKGLWIRATVATTLSVTGARTPVAAIPLCTSWNLIGYPSLTGKSPVDALAGIAGKYDLVYGYNAADTADPWEIYDPKAPPYVNDLATMVAGHGYWIRNTQAATLTVTNRIVTR